MATSDISWREKDVIESVPKSCNDIRTESLPFFTLEEIRAHDKPWDCWMLIHGRVYDIGPILSIHPGGSQILLKYAGMDATYQFDDVGHSMESLIYDMPEGSLMGYIETKSRQELESRNFKGEQVTQQRHGDEFSSDSGDYSNYNDSSIIIGRGQSLDGYLLWNKMYSFFLSLTILFCVFALLYMKLHEHMKSADRMNTLIQRDQSFTALSADQEQVFDTDGIPDWAF